MTTKEQLQKIKYYDSLIQNKIYELNSLKDLTVKVTATLNPIKVQSVGSSQKMSDTVDKIIDLQNSINEDINNYIRVRSETIALIEKIHDTTQYNVIYKRYFEYLTWEQIAVDLNYSYRYIHKVHSRALKRIDMLLREVDQDAAGRATTNNK